MVQYIEQSKVPYIHSYTGLHNEGVWALEIFCRGHIPGGPKDP